jgi:hypothetical protein
MTELEVTELFEDEIAVGEPFFPDTARCMRRARRLDRS